MQLEAVNSVLYRLSQMLAQIVCIWLRGLTERGLCPARRLRLEVFGIWDLVASLFGLNVARFLRAFD